MRSIDKLSEYSKALPLSADSIVEFHAARILLLLKICGRSGRISGLTKMAKLDFFVRYPAFFNQACHSLGVETRSSYKNIESKMIRFHYGPWDQRYYHVLAYLEAKQLIGIEKQGKSFKISLTNLGKRISKKLANDNSFGNLVTQMQYVSQVLGGMRGSQLKNMIYGIFEKEVSQLAYEEVIE